MGNKQDAVKYKQAGPWGPTAGGVGLWVGVTERPSCQTAPGPAASLYQHACWATGRATRVLAHSWRTCSPQIRLVTLHPLLPRGSPLANSTTSWQRYQRCPLPAPSWHPPQLSRSSVRQVARAVLQQDGIAGLYRGVGAVAAGAG